MAKYTQEFKLQIVQLYELGKTASEIIHEYELSNSTFYKWIKFYKQTGSFKTLDNLSNQEKELQKLKLENRKLRMELDILKQATLIMAKK